MARLLVIGASHGIGLAVCKSAARRGHTVRAMARRVASYVDGGQSIESL